MTQASWIVSQPSLLSLHPNEQTNAEQVMLSSARLTKCHASTFLLAYYEPLWAAQADEETGGKIKGAERRTPDLEHTRWAGNKRWQECKLSKTNWKDEHNSLTSNRKGCLRRRENIMEDMGGERKKRQHIKQIILQRKKRTNVEYEKIIARND